MDIMENGETPLASLQEIVRRDKRDPGQHRSEPIENVTMLNVDNTKRELIETLRLKGISKFSGRDGIHLATIKMPADALGETLEGLFNPPLDESNL